jgi:hypothetical protein
VWETPGGLPVDSQWTPGGVVPPGLWLGVPVKSPNFLGLHRDSLWSKRGLHIDSTYIATMKPVKSQCTPTGLHRDSTGTPPGLHRDSTWTPPKRVA